MSIISLLSFSPLYLSESHSRDPLSLPPSILTQGKTNGGTKKEHLLFLFNQIYFCVRKQPNKCENETDK